VQKNTIFFHRYVIYLLIYLYIQRQIQVYGINLSVLEQKCPILSYPILHTLLSSPLLSCPIISYYIFILSDQVHVPQTFLCVLTATQQIHDNSIIHQNTIFTWSNWHCHLNARATAIYSSRRLPQKCFYFCFSKVFCFDLLLEHPKSYLSANYMNFLFHLLLFWQYSYGELVFCIELKIILC
jgi:hypothetical protein